MGAEARINSCTMVKGQLAFCCKDSSQLRTVTKLGGYISGAMTWGGNMPLDFCGLLKSWAMGRQFGAENSPF